MTSLSVDGDVRKEVSRQERAHSLSPVDTMMNKLRAGVEEAGTEIRHSMFSVKASCDHKAAQNLQILQEQVDNAQRTQFILQERNQEVLMIISMLRNELAEVRKLNEAYKQQLKMREQENQISGGESGPSQGDLTDSTVLASRIVSPVHKRADICKTRLMQRTAGKA
ncbi:uncharacterized protein PV09_09774 [Verruconis gallopava]|uniref:Uncharacterized protein n=1 Tax=Verruconis gallopava TaxID=253628 RepID=A0A0D1YCI0_9PEZI|nr:uncharacterized protein PV09_09774 [Verruconis gallopava]KIV98391.1 hypothetical protein PV09_09774 [Verruconis gallopava]